MTTYTTTQVAKRCGISNHSILKAFDSGDLKGFRVPGSHHRRVPESALKEWALRHGIPIDREETAACPTTAPAASASS